MPWRMQMLSKSSWKNTHVQRSRYHHFNSIPLLPLLQPSTALVLQGIGPGYVTVLGEATLPVCMGNEKIDVNFIITESTEVTLGHPFLRETRSPRL